MYTNRKKRTSIMKLNHLLGAVICTISTGVLAQIPGTAVSTLFQDDPDIRAFTGATDSDPNCLQALADGRVVFFESESTAGNNAEDAVILFDASQSGSARFTVIASEAVIGALVGAVTPDIFAEDMTVDANDNVYILGAQAAGGGDNYFVIKIPNTSGTFGVPELIAGFGVAPLGIPPTEGFGAIDYDSANNRLILMLSENEEETALSGIAGLYTLPVLSGQSSPVQSLATRTSMISVLTPVPSSDAGDRATFEDLTVLPNGDIILPFNVRAGTQVSGDSDGDVVRVSSSGTPTIFVDATDLRTEVVADFGLTTTYVEYNSSRNAVAFIEEFTSVVSRNVIAEYDVSGSFQGIVADNTNLLENTGTADVSFRIFSRAFGSRPTGEYLVFTGIDNESCQEITHSAVSSVEDWSFYH